jgi:orotidine-5'-phosphate decarboxylase
MVTDSVANLQAPGLSDRLRDRARAIESWLCIGLDPRLDQLPFGYPGTARGLRDFCREVVSATRSVTLCYKINFAFFEALGVEGWHALEAVRREIPSAVPVIADAKRGDIPSTMRAYARSIFEELRFDAVTVSPYLGWDALEPFLDYPSRAVFVLARTSNPGAADYQDLVVDGEPLYLRVARDAVARETSAEVGVVAGATSLPALRAIRALSEELLILVPGVGAQGGSAAEAVRVAANAEGANALINASRSIIHASADTDFAAEAHVAASRLARETWQG